MEWRGEKIQMRRLELLTSGRRHVCGGMITSCCITLSARHHIHAENGWRELRRKQKLVGGTVTMPSLPHVFTRPKNVLRVAGASPTIGVG